MKRFNGQYISGWHAASDADTASLIDRVIADLERQAERCQRATSNYERAADNYWRITDRH